MMKKAITILLTVLLLMSLCACGDAPTETAAPSTAAPAASTAAPTEETVPTETEPVQNINYLSIGDKIQNDNFTMTFESMDILDEYKYSTGEYSSTSLYVEDGYKLLLVLGHFENTGTKAISDSSFAFTVTVNGEYVVDGFDVRLSFQRDKYFEIDPYTDLDYCLSINIPEKLAEKFENAEFMMGFNDDLSTPETIWNSDGSKTTETDNVYVLSGGLGAAEPSTEPDASAGAPANPAIALGDTISTENYDFTLNNVEIIYELKPKNTSSVYTSYTAPDGKVYIHVDGQYYNKSKKDVCIRDLFTPVAEYDDGYQYEGFAIVDKDDNSFTWASSYVVCTPLETCHYHGLIECPVVIDESDAPLFITLTLDDGNTYRFDIR